MCDSVEGSPPRWLTATESLVLQGFPVHPLQSDLFDKQLTSFHIARDRRPNVVRQQAGNAMFLPKILVSNLHGLLSWRRPQLPSLIVNLRIALRAQRDAQAANQETTAMQPKRRRIKGKQPNKP